MNYIPILPPDAPRDVWLEVRRQGIASSDAAAIVGLSPWGTPLDVWLEKRGLSAGKVATQAMHWGTRLEPVIADAYAERTGRTLEIPPKLIRCTYTPWLLASLDRVSDERIVELKTARTADGWGEPGTDEIPEQYIVQVHHQMLVTGAELADVAVLIGGSDFRVYNVPRNESLIDSLFVREREFWATVQGDAAPDPDWAHAHTPRLIARMHGVADGSQVALPWEMAEEAIVYRSLGEQIKTAEERRDVAKAKILHAMGDAAFGLLPDGSRCSRRLIRRRGFEVAPAEFYQFRVLSPKGM